MKIYIFGIIFFATSITCLAEHLQDTLGRIAVCQRVIEDDFSQIDFPSPPCVVCENRALYDNPENMRLSSLVAGQQDDKDVTQVVVDVASVTPIGLSNLDVARFSTACADRQVAFWYRIYCVVRKRDSESFPLECFVLAVPYFCNTAREWVFYKGMTLTAKLQKRRDGWLFLAAQIARPYGEFNCDDTKVSCEMIKELRDGKEEMKCGLLVNYGDDAIAIYSPGDVVVSGRFGNFYDFNQDGCIKVKLLKESNMAEYLRTAWFKPVVENCENDGLR